VNSFDKKRGGTNNAIQSYNVKGRPGKNRVKGHVKEGGPEGGKKAGGGFEEGYVAAKSHLREGEFWAGLLGKKKKKKKALDQKSEKGP